MNNCNCGSHNNKHWFGCNLYVQETGGGSSNRLLDAEGKPKIPCPEPGCTNLMNFDSHKCAKCNHKWWGNGNHALLKRKSVTKYV